MKENRTKLKSQDHVMRMDCKYYGLYVYLVISQVKFAVNSRKTCCALISNVFLEVINNDLLDEILLTRISWSYN